MSPDSPRLPRPCSAPPPHPTPPCAGSPQARRHGCILTRLATTKFSQTKRPVLKPSSFKVIQGHHSTSHNAGKHLQLRRAFKGRSGGPRSSGQKNLANSQSPHWPPRSLVRPELKSCLAEEEQNFPELRAKPRPQALHMAQEAETSPQV